VTPVLIVEGERLLLRAMAMNLIARGYEVIEASTGSQGLAAAAVHRPDIILLHLGLPDLTGHDVIRAVRAYSQTPIMVLSARTASRDKIGALDVGADDYVT
jgi:two-component system KDP operon response regulator KdpE